MLLGASLMLLQAAQLSVGAGGTFRSIQAAVDAARPGDTVRVAAGVYHEHPVIDSPVVLLGAPGAVIDGDGRGSVLTVTAPATVRGFTIRSSGADQSREHAGIMVRESDGVVIADNRFEDVLFGIYVKQSDSVVIRGNQIVGKNLAMPLRGDGIRLWYSHDGRVADNELRHVRDLVIWFSNGTQVHGNLVRDSRYGLHYMYSDRNRFEENRFIANHVGAFIMYSDDITFRGNLFADARGTTGRGLGFKDADGITAVDNVLVKNAIGISCSRRCTTTTSAETSSSTTCSQWACPTCSQWACRAAGRRWPTHGAITTGASTLDSTKTATAMVIRPSYSSGCRTICSPNTSPCWCTT
jgi:parallel beta-helix repeat protein